MKKISAFTLIEILVVATIIIVLTTISIASFSTANKSARDAKRKGDLETIRQAMVLYKSQNGSYPTTTAPLHTGAVKYISPPFPLDPSGGSYEITTEVATFCFCATSMESTKGNKTTRDCATNDWLSTPTGANYCVQQPY